MKFRKLWSFEISANKISFTMCSKRTGTGTKRFSLDSVKISAKSYVKLVTSIENKAYFSIAP